jgi:hypothetical protein
MSFKDFLAEIFTSRAFWGWIIVLGVSSLMLGLGKIDGPTWGVMNGASFAAFIASNKIGDKMSDGK